MTLLPRLSLAAAVAATVLLLPAAADAQSRRAVPRVVPSRPVNVSAGVYYGPRVYPRYYASPFWYGGFYGSPFFYGGWGGWGAWGPGPWYPGPFYGGYGWGGVYDAGAALRLQVTPREAEVFVDGYYAGRVDDFDGVFQRLNVQPGEHKLEVYLPGHRPLQQKVYAQPGRTFVVKEALEALAPGEAEPPRPTPTAHPPGRRANTLRTQRDAGREPSVATPAGFGTVALRVQPGDASISIDGEPWEISGANERLVVQLGEGPHNIEIRLDGYRTYITDITVRPGETTPLNVVLTPEP